MTKHLVQRVFEEIGEFELRSYSGRGMYGQTCLGVEFDGSIGKLVAELVAHTECLDTQDDIHDLAEALRGMRLDSMGYGQIAYFPNVPWVAFECDFDRCCQEAATEERGGMKYCAAHADEARCDFDECTEDASQTRGCMRYCPRHAEEHDELVREDAPDYRALTDTQLEHLGDHGRTPEVQAAANQELLRRDAK